ncbi:MAG: hypothetical protein CBB65_12810 [Hyphomonadaceae bacterium TMED5]|nr:MAG: hypothetical protein CBB65_12810 [Hyphomonadaceae bacterium TMED5]
MGGYTGSSWNPNDAQWRLGDQMRRHNEAMAAQKKSFETQQKANATPTYVRRASSTRDKGDNSGLIALGVIGAVVVGIPALIMLIAMIDGW